MELKENYSSLIKFIDDETPGTLLQRFTGIIHSVAVLQTRIHKLRVLMDEHDRFDNNDDGTDIDPEDLYFLNAFCVQLIDLMRIDNLKTAEPFTDMKDDSHTEIQRLKHEMEQLKLENIELTAKLELSEELYSKLYNLYSGTGEPEGHLCVIR